MKLKLVRHLWGVDSTHGLEDYLPRWRDVGYEALEVPIRGVPDRAAFFGFLKDNDLGWVPQIFSHGSAPGNAVRDHLESLRTQMEDCLAGQDTDILGYGWDIFFLVVSTYCHFFGRFV